MEKRQEISIGQFIFQFWKKALTLLLGTAFVWGIIRALCLHFDLIPWIDNQYVDIGVPLILTLCLDFYLFDDTDSSYVPGIGSPRSIDGRDLGCTVLALTFFLVLFNVNHFVEYSMKDIVSVPTINQDNLSECIEADYIHVDKLTVHEGDFGHMDKSYSYTEKSKEHFVTEVFDVIPLQYLPDVYVCKCREGQDETSLMGVRFANLYLKRVTSTADLKQYRAAASHCRTPLPQGTQIEDIVFLEVTSEADVTRGNYAWLYILGALLGGPLLWSFIFACSTTGPYYPLKRHPFFKKSGKKKVNILWLYIRRAFKPYCMFVWYIPVISIIVYIVEIFLGYTPKYTDSEILYEAGAATPNSIFSDGEYWRLISCVFVNAEVWHLITYNLLYCLLAGISCFLFYGRWQSNFRIILLAIFFWTGTITANLIFVASGHPCISGTTGFFTLSGITLAHLLFLKEEKKGLFKLSAKEFFYGIWAICSVFPFFEMLYLHRNFLIVLSGFLCGFVLQFIVEIYEWLKRKNEDKDGTQNYQKEYTTINQGE